MIKRKSFMYGIIFFCGVFVATLYASAQNMQDEELDRWFEENDQQQSYEDISGGEQLEFISPVVDRVTPFIQTQLDISEESLQTGWVGISQCYDGLDPVSDAEVVYSFNAMRGLHISEKRGIAEARVVGQTIHLKNILKGAKLCVEMEAAILQSQGNKKYVLHYGPIMRKFLDSYFPMHIAMEISYPPSRLRLNHVAPVPMSDYSHSERTGQIVLDTWFKGKLDLEIVFTEYDDIS